MRIILAAIAVLYIAFATLQLWRRPGYFAALILCSYGLAAFFGPIGTFTSIGGMIAVASARLVGHEPPIGLAQPEFWLVVFLIFVLVGIPFSPQLDDTFAYFSLLVGLGLVSYLYGRTFATHPTFIRDVFWGSALASTISFIQLASSANRFARLGQSNEGSNLGPIGLANLCEVSFCGAFAMVLFDRSLSTTTRIALIAFIVGIVLPFVLATGTRSVMISLTVVFLVFSAVYFYRSSGRTRRLFLLSLIGGLPAALALVVALAPSKFLLLALQGILRSDTSIGSSNDRSGLERIYEYTQAFDLFKHSPVVGTGLGSYGYLVDGQAGEYPHNLELELLVSFGLVGTILFFLFLVPLFGNAFRALMRYPLQWDRVAIAGLLISTFIRHQLSFTFAAGKLLFFTTGCFAAWQLLDRQKAAAPEVDAAVIQEPSVR